MPGYIKLTRAKLCVDCDGIFETGDTCPVCGSMTWKYLRNWIKPLSSRLIPCRERRNAAMEGQLNERCPKCGQAYTWEKMEFIRDGYSDWRLYVMCRCGQVDDPEILVLARKDYDRALREKIVAEQRRSLERCLGIRLHRHLERIVQNHNPNRMIRMERRHAGMPGM